MITIKQITHSEVEDVVLLFDAYRIFYKQDSDANAVKTFLLQRLLKNESVIFVAYKDGIAVAFTQLYPIFSSVSLHNAFLLNDLYVSEAARGNGVATMLLDKAKQFGKEENAKFLMLQTAADNFKAQAVYEKNNWSKETDFFYSVNLI
jgi:GNAT superfamily N-acetyltransferase